MKTGVSSYSYSAAVREGRISFIEIPALAKKTGFEDIEFSELTVPVGETRVDFARRLRDACDEADIEVSNYCEW